MLDLSNPKVQDFIFGIVDNLMTKHPEIDYIKWDANMPIMNHGSGYLGKGEQSHLYIAYHRGFESICKRIRSKYPDLTIQAWLRAVAGRTMEYYPILDEFWAER